MNSEGHVQSSILHVLCFFLHIWLTFGSWETDGQRIRHILGIFIEISVSSLNLMGYFLVNGIYNLTSLPSYFGGFLMSLLSHETHIWLLQTLFSKARVFISLLWQFLGAFQSMFTILRVYVMLAYTYIKTQIIFLPFPLGCVAEDSLKFCQSITFAVAFTVYVSKYYTSDKSLPRNTCAFIGLNPFQNSYLPVHISK